MDTSNNNPEAAAPTPTPDPTLAAKAPEATPAPTPTPAPAPAPAPVGKIEIPQTSGKTPGGWNRFAGYDPNAAKNKQQRGRREGSRGHR